MLVYRISKTQYAEDLNGTGAKLYGGRWNHIDTPCIYTASSRSLAILEFSVNVNIDYIPRALSICIFEIDETMVKEFEINKLPGDWKDVPSPFSTKEFGTKLLEKGNPIIKLPSIIIPDEFNFILNPMAFVYDLRIKSK